jgi:poly-gamma-glutamate synthesis protein (capsule biosynthesis protein)
MSKYLDSFDLVVGNLEGTITELPSLSLSTVPGQPGNTTFTFPTSTGDLLFRHNVRLVSLANNHSLDFGRSGLESTRALLSAASVGFFGDPLDPSRKSIVKGVGGVPVAFVGFNQFLGVDSVQATVEEIERVKTSADHVVVFAHWGDEYVQANEFQKMAAHAFVDAGADVVVGAHPHVIQESEVYSGSLIYYSLGNFIFDQYWDDAVRTGLVLEALITPDDIVVTPRKAVRTRTLGPCLVYNAE